MPPMKTQRRFKIGTTGKGIGPTYTDKVGRNGLRVGDIFHDFEEKYAVAKAKHTDMLKMMGMEANVEDLEQNGLKQSII